ncbi:MAG: hypothetical protein CMH69_16225 [Nitratireductor sp.]|nr:hypothetical protein [Nitratireductor sp.]
MLASLPILRKGLPATRGRMGREATVGYGDASQTGRVSCRKRRRVTETGCRSNALTCMSEQEADRAGAVKAA